MLLILLVLLLPFDAHAQVRVTTWHNNLARTGVNPEETILTPAKVNPEWFGRVFSYRVDGNIHAQPLYLPSLQIPGKGLHNVVFVATQRASVYAFDADSNAGENAAPLWHVNLLAVGETPVSTDDIADCVTITPELGITGTPVIDPATNTIYLVAMSIRNGSITHRLHALDATTGAGRPGSPVVIDALVPGTGDSSPFGIRFQPYLYKNRNGLLLLNGVIYTTWSSHCDRGPYHGWVIGYDARDLRQVMVFNATPNGYQGAFWMGGAAPAADGDGNLYVISGNGTYDDVQSNFGNSVLKLSSRGQVLDYFTPFNQLHLDRRDIDLGSSAAILLPDEAGSLIHRRLLVSAGKEGRIYLLDRDKMGRFRADGDSQIVQSLLGAIGPLYGGAAYFNRTLYFAAAGDALKAFSLVDGRISGEPASRSPHTIAYPGAVPTISANGTSDGVVWLIETANGGTLHAYDASNVALELFNSSTNPSRDALGSFVRLSVPAIANGRVYVGTQDSLVVYGLLLPEPSPMAPVNAASFQPGAVAPGSLISIFGKHLASTTAFAPATARALNLAGVTLTINGIAAPLLFVSPDQINALVPPGLAIGPATAVLQLAGAPPVSIPFTIAPAAPGIFTVWNSDGSVNTPANPAPAGSVIVAYGTGLGAVDVLDRSLHPVTATIGGQSATVVLARQSPLAPGLFEVHLQMPASVSGSHDLLITVNGVTSNRVTVGISGF